jgi:hypothetical protein
MALQTLHDGTVLAIHGHQLAAPGRLCRHHQIATRDQALLVRQRQPLPRQESLDGGFQTGGPHKGIHNHIHVRRLNDLRKSLPSRKPASRRKVLAVIQLRFIGQSRNQRPVSADLMGKSLQRSVGRQRHHPEAIRVPADDLEGAPPDGTGRAQDGNSDQ